ncbi:MAG: Glycosyl transferase family 2 [Microgenomates group bacterium GW2011_GWA1_48_10]|nr:MAG: Glycosyl transferase family 2 [Microgenomates group bacterium GW2011_GWA1_48_10]
MKLSIIVPAYNEEKTITKVIDKLLRLKIRGWHKDVIVVDDASTDQTLQLLKNYRGKITLIHHLANRGKTAAIRTAVRQTSGDYIIIQDADLEYDPKDIPLLIRALGDSKDAVVFGSRFATSKYVDTVFGHKFGNKLLTLLANLLYRSDISDMETCYKLIPGPFLRSITLQSDRFGFEPEITAKVLRSGRKIKEVPISYVKRSVTEGKSIRWWRDGWATVAILIRYRL